MNPKDLEIILKHIRDEVLSVKGSLSQDMDRRNEYVTEKITNDLVEIFRQHLKELFHEEIKPLKQQANDNMQDIRLVKRVAFGIGTVCTFLGIDKIIAALKGIIG